MPLRNCARALAAGAALVAACLVPPARALDVIDPTGAVYVNASDSSHFAAGWEAANLFNRDVSSTPTGTVLGGTEFAKNGTGTAYVAFELDKAYAQIGSVFYAQRAGASATADKISRLSIWASTSSPFAAADPGTTPDSVVAITNTTGGLWLEYLLTSTISGQYFLVKFEQATASGNPGGNELRLGANLGLPPTIYGMTPASTNTYSGNGVRFSVQVGGTGPMRYQWQAGPVGSGVFSNLLSGANISGTTNASIEFSNLQPGDADLRVVVANASGSATSSPAATLSVSTSLPQIVTPITPATLAQAAGYTLTLSVGVAGSLPMTYQWQRDGVNLADDARVQGAHSNVLAIADAQAVDAGRYRLVITNAYGSATSDEAVVTIVPSLAVIGPSGAIYTQVSDSSHFSASYVAANLFKNDVTGLAPGSTLGGSEYARSGPGTAWVAFQVDAVYTVGSIYFAQRAGSTTGDNMQKMSVWTSETTPFTATDPGTTPNATLSLLANVGTPVWREYFLANNITGRYFLLKLEQTTVTGNPGGNELRLGLAQQTPAIVAQPTNQVAYSGNTVQFTVGASGAPPLAYQWQARTAGSTGAFADLTNGTEILGARSATLTLKNVSLGDMEYRVKVSNGAGSAMSDTATLTVSTSAPQIVTDARPATLHQPAGFGFALTVGVIGSGPMNYQWVHNGLPLADTARITGSRSNVLSVATAQAADAGTYQLFMTNSLGNNASAVVTVVIEPEFGFYDGSAWTLNGGATVDAGGALVLTDGGTGQARSAFFNTPVSVDAFTATFTYQDVSVGGADGATFVLQNAPAGPAALGPGGGYLGYVGISPSVALAFNLYGNPGLALRTGGTVGPYASTAPVNLGGGAPIAVKVQYASGTLVVTLTDTWSTESYTNAYSLDLAAAVGGRTAFIGFTGADGAVTSVQQISDVRFLPTPAGPPQLLTDIRPAQLVQPAGLAFSLSAGVSGTAPIAYQWKFNGVNLQDDSRITGVHSNSLRIAYALPGDVGQYQLFATNYYGWTNSGLATVTLTNLVDFGNGSAWSLNGGCSVLDGVLALTDPVGGQTRSAFLGSKVPIDAFLASFTYQDVSVGGADGVAFILHNSPDGALALGGGGGGLGYSGISPSAAIEFNIYSGSAGGRGIAFGTNGLTAQNGGDSYTTTAPLNLASGHPIDMVLRYAGGILSLSLTDAVDNVSFSTNLAVNLPQIVGGSVAYVGFSGATGGSSAQQQISNFRFTTLPQLAIEAAGPDSAVVSWPVTATGFVLQQASKLGATGWDPVTTPAQTINGRQRVTVNSPTAERYYRLSLP